MLTLVSLHYLFFWIATFSCWIFKWNRLLLFLVSLNVLLLLILLSLSFIVLDINLSFVDCISSISSNWSLIVLSFFVTLCCNTWEVFSESYTYRLSHLFILADLCCSSIFFIRPQYHSIRRHSDGGHISCTFIIGNNQTGKWSWFLLAKTFFLSNHCHYFYTHCSFVFYP